MPGLSISNQKKTLPTVGCSYLLRELQDQNADDFDTESHQSLQFDV
jgi:hypothetical protein